MAWVQTNLSNRCCYCYTVVDGGSLLVNLPKRVFFFFLLSLSLSLLFHTLKNSQFCQAAIFDVVCRPLSSSVVVLVVKKKPARWLVFFFSFFFSVPRPLLHTAFDGTAHKLVFFSFAGFQPASLVVLSEPTETRMCSDQSCTWTRLQLFHVEVRDDPFATKSLLPNTPAPSATTTTTTIQW